MVVAGAARLADEIGLANVTMGLLTERLGVRAPSLYKHIDGQADLNRQIAVLALTELGDALRDALQGRSGRDVLSAAARTIRGFVLEHPGRYAATVRIDATGPDDTVHALRMLRDLLHGSAVLEAAGGFQMDTDVDDCFEWLVDFADRGLRQLSQSG